jgi:Flp pilus assembly protein TadB
MSGALLETTLAAALCGGAVAVALPGGARSRLGMIPRGAQAPCARSGAGTAGGGGEGHPDAAWSRASGPWSAAAASCCGAVGAAVVLGGVPGVVAGVVTGVVAFAVLRRLEPRAARQRRERLAADLPTAVDLLGACLAAGRPPAQAVSVVASAVGGPLARELDVVTVRLDLGADPVGVWRDVGLHGGALAPLGRTMARSLETGSPMADGLGLLADDLRRRRRAAVEQRARGVGVRAAAPLGLCFLPAFVLIGIVPSVLGAFASLSLW